MPWGVGSVSSVHVVALASAAAALLKNAPSTWWLLNSQSDSCKVFDTGAKTSLFGRQNREKTLQVPLVFNYHKLKIVSVFCSRFFAPVENFGICGVFPTHVEKNTRYFHGLVCLSQTSVTKRIERWKFTHILQEPQAPNAPHIPPCTPWTENCGICKVCATRVQKHELLFAWSFAIPERQYVCDIAKPALSLSVSCKSLMQNQCRKKILTKATKYQSPKRSKGRIESFFKFSMPCNAILCLPAQNKTSSFPIPASVAFQVGFRNYSIWFWFWWSTDVYCNCWLLICWLLENLILRTSRNTKAWCGGSLLNKISWQWAKHTADSSIMSVVWVYWKFNSFRDESSQLIVA